MIPKGLIKVSLNNRPYHSNVFVLIGKDDLFIEFMDKNYSYDITEKLGDASGYFVMQDWLIDSNGVRFMLVWIKSFEYTHDDFNTLSHELLHIVFRVMERADVRYSRDSEEAFTYLLGDLMEQFLTKYKKKLNNLKLCGNIMQS